MNNRLKNFRILYLILGFVVCSVLLHAQPVITNVTPYMGIPGSSITITGTGFNATAGNNIVYFGATRAAVTAGGATSLTATLPIGATFKEVTVNNTATALTGYSKRAFLPVYDTTPYITSVLNFDNRVDFAAPGIGLQLAVGDIDGDGKPDFATCISSSTIACVYRNTSTSGTASVAAGINFSSGGGQGISMGDIDGDGKPDIVTANFPSNTISVLRNTSSTGSITFAAKVDFTTLGRAFSVAIGDMDGDGKSDLVVTNIDSDKISVLRNIGAPGIIAFAPKVDFATGTYPRRLAVADIDGDGKPDIAVPNNLANTVSVFRNTGTSGVISLAPKVDFTTGTHPAAAVIGDIDGDGKPEIAIANQVSSSVSVLRNTGSVGTIAFSSRVDFTAGSNTSGLAIGDINGDSRPDIAAGNISAATVSILLNTGSTGTITFATNIDCAAGAVTGASPYDVAIADIDGDSLPDLTFPTLPVFPASSISILRNNPLHKIVGAPSVCLGSNITLTNGTAGGTWSSGNTSVATVGSASGVVTGVALGTAGITYTFPGGVHITNVVVTVSLPPIAGTITGPTAVLVGGTAALSNATTGGVWSSGSPSVATISTSGIVTGVSPGTCVISYGVSGGCTVYNTMTINVSYAPPVITNVSPYMGIPGSSITITGTGFNATAANNIVFFGATQATVIAASATSLTVTVPTGSTYMDVSVTNVASALTGYSQYSFLSTYDNSPYVSSIIHLADKIDFTSSMHPISSAVGDIDGDNKPDVVVCFSSPGVNHFSTYRNISTSGTIAFAAPVNISIVGTTAPFFTAIRDIDGDGKPDVVVANYNSASTSVFRNTSTSGIISFASQVNFATGTDSRYVAIDDVDGDGKADIAVINVGSNNVSILRNTGSSGVISFAPKVDFAVDGPPFGLAIGDIDGDGKPDLATASSFSGTISVLRNTCSAGIISFAARIDIGGGLSPLSIVIGDIDGDGKADLATTNPYLNNIAVLQNTGSSGIISFAANQYYATGASPYGISAGDINGDGKPDLAVTNSTAYTISVLRNTSSSGSVSFAGKVDYTTATTVSYLSTCDIDGDSKPDVVVTCNNASSNGFLSVFRNDPYYKIAGTPSVCLGGSTTLTNSTTGGTWSSSNTSVATVGSLSGTVTGMALGTADISYTFPGGSNMTSVVVTVVTYPNAGLITGASTLDVDASTYFSNSVSGGVWSSSSPTVATVGTDGLVTGVSIGTINITYTVTNACGTAYTTQAITVVLPKPVIILVSPYIGIPGATATITGTGFNPTPSHNIVYFGATKATVLSASSTMLSVTLPIGCIFKYVSVTNTASSLTGNSPLPFLPSFDNSPYIPGTINFDSKVDFASVSYLSKHIAAGDIDGDGKADMVTSSHNAGNISIYRNTGTSGTVSFATYVSISAATPTHVAISDINGDGKLDLVYSSLSLNTVSVLLNLSSPGTITFAPELSFATSLTPSSIACGDIDGDGKTDIAVINDNDSSFSLLRNTGSVGMVSFAPKEDFATLSGPRGIAIGDINGDNKPDIVVTSSGWGHFMSVFRNASSSGVISLAGRQDFSSSFHPLVTTIADIDGDSKVDVITSNSGSNSISVFRNTSAPDSITFAAKVDFATGDFPMGMSIGDVDGDGKPEIAVANFMSNTPSLLKNMSTIGTISFSPQMALTTSSDPSIGTQTVAIADVDGDGLADLTLPCRPTSAATYVLSVFRNNPLHYITGPTNVCVGSNITLYNANIGGEWTSGNPAVATVGSSTGIVTGMAVGTVTIYYSFPGNTNYTSIVVNVTPGFGMGGITGVGTVCTGTTTSLSALVSGGIWSSASPAIATVGSSGLVTGVAAGTGVISYTVTNSCGTTYATTVVTVNTTAIPGAITGSATVCAGSTATLANTVSGGVWSSSDASVATVGTSGVVTGVTAGTSDISYVLTAGSCATFATKGVTVNTSPALNTGVSTMCIGGTTLLSNTVTGGTWSSSTPTKATVNPSTGLVTAVSIGTSNISYTMSNGCYSLTQVSVNLLLTGNIAGSDLCIGAPGAFSHPVTGGVWTSSNPAVATIDATTGVVTGVGVGTTTITYTVGSCYRTRTVVVGSLGSSGSGTITGSSTVCDGATTVITGPETGLAWTSSDPSVATIGITSGMVTGVTVGTVIMTFFYTHGCMYLTKPMTVMPLPTPVSGIMALCQDYTTTLASVGTTGGTWTSSDLSSVAIDMTSGVVLGLSGGTSIITYTWTNTCQQMATVTVNPMPVPVAIVGSGIVMVGSSAVLMPSAPGGTWATSNPAIATLMPSGSSACIMTGISAGLVTITYTNTNGCGTTTVTRIFHVAAPRPGGQQEAGSDIFSISPNPTTGVVTIEAPVVGTFSVYTIDGRFVQEYQVQELSTTINLPNTLASGIYMGRFNGEDGSTVMVRLVYER